MYIYSIYVYIQSRNLGTDGTIARTIVVNINSMAHVCSRTFLSIFLRSHSFLKDFSKMSEWGLNVEGCI